MAILTVVSDGTENGFHVCDGKGEIFTNAMSFVVTCDPRTSERQSKICTVVFRIPTDAVLARDVKEVKHVKASVRKVKEASPLKGKPQRPRSAKKG